MKIEKIVVRMQVRCTKKQKAMIVKAAKLSGLSVSKFIFAVAYVAATSIVLHNNDCENTDENKE